MSVFYHKMKIIILIIFLILPAHIFAEIVYLKSGQIITGRVSRHVGEDIELQIGDQKQIIPKQLIKKIRYISLTDEQKQQQAERARMTRLAARKRRQQIESANLANSEKQRQLLELETKEYNRKKTKAKNRAERAAALRELVDKGKMEKPKDEAISYWDFAWRSLLLPGWGHLKIDRPKMGAFYMAATAGLLYNIYERRLGAYDAMKENHRQAELNFILTVLPNLAPIEIRTGYAQYSNAQALEGYQDKIDAYHTSLNLLAVFYGLQVLHIIYNGIAWETGLLIVDKKDYSPKLHTFQPVFSMTPEYRADGRSGNQLRAGVNYVF